MIGLHSPGKESERQSEVCCICTAWYSSVGWKAHHHDRAGSFLFPVYQSLIQYTSSSTLSTPRGPNSRCRFGSNLPPTRPAKTHCYFIMFMEFIESLRDLEQREIDIDAAVRVAILRDGRDDNVINLIPMFRLLFRSHARTTSPKSSPPIKLPCTRPFHTPNALKMPM